MRSGAVQARLGWSLLVGAGLSVGNAARPQTASRAAEASRNTAGDRTAALDSALPEVHQLLTEVERNQRRMETLQRDYTYHVHTVMQTLDKQGGVKKSETTDAESLTIKGVRVDRTVARDGHPLNPEEQRKEDQRIDKDVAKAVDRRGKAESKGEETDARGNSVVPLSRILELGSFSNPRREDQGGRASIVLDYRGNPKAKTRNAFEGAMRDLSGTLWIDEQDRVLVRAKGHFTNDFKVGGGLLADVRDGTNFQFSATRIDTGVWLPAHVEGHGSVRVLLLANFTGRMQITTNDYRRFRTNTVIRPGNGVIGSDGEPIP